MRIPMRGKLTLKLDDLRVDSFDTTRSQQPKGTVFGEQCTCYTNCTCPGCPSCDDTCPDTCAYSCGVLSCNGTCGGVGCYDSGETCGRYCGSSDPSGCIGLECP
jgi:hypothetical protein